MSKKVNLNILIVAIIIALFLFGCDKPIEWNPQWENRSASKIEGKVVTDWNDMFLILSRRTDGYRAPVAARVLAYMNWAAYEAVAPGMENYKSIASQFPTIKVPIANSSLYYHWAVSANEAYYYSIINYVPLMDSIRKKQVDSLHIYHKKRLAFECDTTTYNNSLNFGKAAALSILAYADTDGGAKAYLNNKPHDYNPPIGPEKWRRTFPDYLDALTPFWPSIRPIMAKVENSDFIAPLPYRIDSSSAFYQAAMEVYQTSKNSSATEKWIADFWSDDIQFFTFDAASRWISISNQVVTNKKLSLEEAVYTNTKVGIALFDGSIACWKEKYVYKLLRPVSYIQLYIDANWRTLLNDKVKTKGDNVGITPAHPSYPSGHSTFGEVAAVVLTDIFGNNVTFTDKSHEGRTDFLSTPRSFNNFDEMSKENAYSRIPLGVHYRMDCDEGLRIGKIIGQQVNAWPWKKGKAFVNL
jgi:membrane-associated phospholipid phosphatase